MNPIFNGCGPPSIFQPSDARTKVQLHCRSPGRDSSDLWDVVAVATGLGMRVLDIYIYIYEYMYHIYIYIITYNHVMVLVNYPHMYIYIYHLKARKIRGISWYSFFTHDSHDT